MKLEFTGRGNDATRHAISVEFDGVNGNVNFEIGGAYDGPIEMKKHYPCEEILLEMCVALLPVLKHRARERRRRMKR